MLATLRQYQSV